MSYSQFLIPCFGCGNLTSRAYARKNAGKCKSCVTGQPATPKGLRCPTCGNDTLTPFQRSRGYHCDGCTRQADPEGCRREVMGLND